MRVAIITLAALMITACTTGRYVPGVGYYEDGDHDRIELQRRADFEKMQRQAEFERDQQRMADEGAKARAKEQARAKAEEQQLAQLKKSGITVTRGALLCPTYEALLSISDGIAMFPPVVMKMTPEGHATIVRNDARRRAAQLWGCFFALHDFPAKVYNRVSPSVFVLYDIGGVKGEAKWWTIPCLWDKYQVVDAPPPPPPSLSLCGYAD